ncbi:NUDIX hydrolase [soil metagenome]
MGGVSDESTVRPSARVILIGPDDRTLLFRGGDPHRPENGTWWVVPGGGIDQGESPEEAARRELWEETGHVDVSWGGLVAPREVTFTFMEHTFISRESFYLARTTSLEVTSPGFTDLELATVEEHRWCDIAALRGLREPVYPGALPEVLADLCAGRFPPRPWTWSE